MRAIPAGLFVLLAATLAACDAAEEAAVQPDTEAPPAASVAQEEAAELVLGRWCDRMVPNNPDYWVVLEIVSEGDRVFRRMIEPGGNVSEAALTEQGGNVFARSDSPTGDSYRIVPNDGALQLIDNDGLIRTARRLENQPTPGECSR